MFFNKIYYFKNYDYFSKCAACLPHLPYPVIKTICVNKNGFNVYLTEIKTSKAIQSSPIQYNNAKFTAWASSRCQRERARPN